jgi:NAD(P)-dependent dehydrogenase (short-subunit alcohol dehydrogenase family)
MKLKNEVVIITGAGSGIGKECSLNYASNGAKLILIDRNQNLLNKINLLIKKKFKKISTLKFLADISNEKDVKLIIDSTIKKFKKIDVLHSHVGIQVEGTAEQVDPKGMDDSYKINVKSHFNFIRATLPYMKKRKKGSIIVTSSNSGVIYDSEMVAYATSKHAAVAMVKQIAKDYAKYNIRVNALCPGWVDTPFNDPFTKQMGGRNNLLKYISKNIPMKRFASPKEISDAALFLASSDSSFMTGQALVVDGGECL